MESLSLHEKHDGNNRNADSNQHNGKSTKGPAEVVVSEEEVGNTRTGKGGSNSGSSVDGGNEHSVLEGRAISEHNVDNINHADVTIQLGLVLDTERREQVVLTQSSRKCEPQSTFPCYDR